MFTPDKKSDAVKENLVKNQFPDCEKSDLYRMLSESIGTNITKRKNSFKHLHRFSDYPTNAWNTVSTCAYSWQIYYIATKFHKWQGRKILRLQLQLTGFLTSLKTSL